MRALVDAVPPIVLAWVLTTSVAAFVLSVWDKAQAKRRRSRIPERVLLGAALAGGTPGLIVGMLLARHKTRKVRFLAQLALVMVIQAIGVWWLART